MSGAVTQKAKRTFGLVLGGGGVRCLSHLGLASVLEEEQLQPDLLVSSSTGSLMGVLLATGVPTARIREALFDSRQRLRWWKPEFRGGGLYSQDAMLYLLDSLGVPERLEDLPVPLHVVVTDLESSEMRVYEEGECRPIVLASAALPGVYAPVTYEGRYLSDGGISNNVPADVCRAQVGEDGFVLSSSLEMNPLTPRELLKYLPQILYRSIYLPQISRRTQCVTKHSDLLIQPFSDQPLSFSRWREIVRFWSVVTMADLYEIGRNHMVRELPQLRAQLACLQREGKEQS